LKTLAEGGDPMAQPRLREHRASLLETLRRLTEPRGG
jgi:hypothetical protein